MLKKLCFLSVAIAFIVSLFAAVEVKSTAMAYSSAYCDFLTSAEVEDWGIENPLYTTIDCNANNHNYANYCFINAWCLDEDPDHDYCEK